MHRLPTPPVELAGLPDPASPASRTAPAPGGPRWARPDLNGWYLGAGPAAAGEHEALSAALDKVRPLRL